MYHRSKRDQHIEIIKNLKAAHNALGDEDPIDSDDDEYDIFDHLVSTEERVSSKFKLEDLKTAQAEAHER